MKKEIFEEGLRIANNIRFLEHEINKLNDIKKDLESKGVQLNKKRIWDLVKSNKDAHLYLAIKSGKNIDDKLWKELYPKRELCYS